MSNTGGDREVLQAVAGWRGAGHGATLVTVLDTWGSAPRPAGSLMAVRADGLTAGSVSGGCIEDDLRTRLVGGDLAALAKPTTLDYGVDGDQARRFGLPCGGRLSLLLEPVTDTSRVETVLGELGQRRRLIRRLDIATGTVTLAPADREASFRHDNGVVETVFGPTWRLLLIGTGHLSRCVARMAAPLEYEVIACDPRREHHAEWDPAVGTLDARMPDDAVTALADDPRSAVLALTHDPKLDDMALMTALESRAFYVGALGSRRSNERRRARLAELGLSAAAIGRLHGPVGLSIGSRTPPEIAVAILAELTAVRHGRRLVEAAVDAEDATSHDAASASSGA